MIPQLRRVGQHAAIYALARQEALAGLLSRRLGSYRWDADLMTRHVTFSSPKGQIQAEGQVLASVAVSPRSVMWGFAAPFAPYVGTSPAAVRIRQFGLDHGIEALQHEETEYQLAPDQDPAQAAAALSHDVGMLATEVFGPGTMYYAGTTTTGSRQIFLLTRLPVPAPEISLRRLFPSLARYAMAVDDIDWSLQGLVSLMPGWSLTRHPDGATTAYQVADAAGSAYTLLVTRDDLGRVTNIFMT